MVGGGTGLIGDPSGKASERPMLSREEIQANTEGIARQLQRLLEFDGPRAARLVDNADWLCQLLFSPIQLPGDQLLFSCDLLPLQ